MTKKNFKIRFKEPKHGWLPVDIELGNFEFKCYASHILSTSFHEMISKILLLENDQSFEFKFFLEPDFVVFKVEKIENEFLLQILKRIEDSNDEKYLIKFNGNFNSVIVPFYRSIKRLETFNFENEKYWLLPSRKYLNEFYDYIKQKNESE